ncbi:tetratricopeptide repeat protein [Sphingomonas sp. URHD0057]|uniref:tetratricopeptide repeat protein n=1 Tax=Sphingomonas sp. URHD0057 TaxID=1380389 RepID=UPI0006867C89|nr:tetratricopeptide repeat protein [Sphingomonas sp. URHD0057]
MAKPSRLGTAVPLAALATLLTGCASGTDGVRTASYQSGKPDGDVGLATRAMAALNDKDLPTAIDLAEKAVAKTPDDAGFRGLLGNAYFAAGRFASAESAYKDALSIYENQPQMVLKLALVEIAQGKTSEAANLLESGRSMLDAADYGLAIALAGRPADAIATLQTAARDKNADSRVRQNLALAYALSGDWANAKTIAAQDVAANQLDARIQQWMELVRPSHPADQVAALTGVKPAIDPGQPVRLALRQSDTPLAQANVDPTPAPAVVEPAPVQQVAEAAPVPQPQTFAPAPPPADPVRVAATVEQAPAPVALAAIAPEAPAAFVAMAARFAPAPKPAKARRAPVKVRPAAMPVGKGPVMQLGAYKSPQYVNAAWSQLTKKYPALHAYLPLRARFDSPKGTFYRLSVQGFANQREALARCQLLKSRGGTCFVRGFAGDAPVQIASR